VQPPCSPARSWEALSHSHSEIGTSLSRNECADAGPRRGGGRDAPRVEKLRGARRDQRAIDAVVMCVWQGEGSRRVRLMRGEERRRRDECPAPFDRAGESSTASGLKRHPKLGAGAPPVEECPPRLPAGSIIRDHTILPRTRLLGAEAEGHLDALSLAAVWSFSCSVMT
jgi:hypothetical protein